MNLLAWTPTYLRPQHHPILAAVERHLEKVLPPIGQEPEGRLADALAALLALLDCSPETPAVSKAGTRWRPRASEMRPT